MTLGERIKKARKELNLTQQEFAEKISTTQNTIARYEAEARTPPNSTISLICRTFRVNEEWLRGGVGEMFLKTDGNILSELAEEFNLSDKQKAVISAFLKLTDEQKDAIIEAISAVAAEMEQLDAEKQTPTEPPLPPAQEEPEEEKPDTLSDEEWEMVKKHRYETKVKIKGGINNNSGIIKF